MHICFLMYPWERVSPETDTTLRLVHECVARDYYNQRTDDSRQYGIWLLSGDQKGSDNSIEPVLMYLIDSLQSAA